MTITRLFGACACIWGGVIMLLFQSAGTSGYSMTGHNAFEVMSHGVGLIGVGIGLTLFNVPGHAAVREKKPEPEEPASADA